MSTTPTDSTQAAMQAFTASWYNYLVKALSLDPSTFQLMQGTVPLGTDSTGLFQMADSMPPLSINNSFDNSQWNRFSANYKQLLFAQIDDSSDHLKKVLGDKYFGWTEFRNNFYSKNTDSTDPQEKVFDVWTQRALDPGQIPPAKAAFSDTLLAPVATAIASFVNPINFFQGVPKFNKGMDDIRTALRGTPTTSIDFDSSNTSADIRNTWAKGSIKGGYGIFSGSASTDYNKLNEKASGASIVIKGSIANRVTVPIGPGAWFDAGIFTRALKNNDNYTWDVNKSTSWESCFGPGGSIARMITGLIVVDGLNVTITSKANYSKEDYEALKAEASLSFFPFVSASGSGGSSTDIKQNNDGTISVTYTSKPGNPSILGASVKTVADLF